MLGTWNHMHYFILDGAYFFVDAQLLHSISVLEFTAFSISTTLLFLIALEFIQADDSEYLLSLSFMLFRDILHMLFYFNQLAPCYTLIFRVVYASDIYAKYVKIPAIHISTTAMSFYHALHYHVTLHATLHHATRHATSRYTQRYLLRYTQRYTLRYISLHATLHRATRQVTWRYTPNFITLHRGTHLPQQELNNGTERAFPATSERVCIGPRESAARISTLFLCFTCNWRAAKLLKRLALPKNQR